jgi:hypothetical protein
MAGWVLGLTGDIVVWCAWFGAASVSNSGLHAYGGDNGLGAMVIVFIAIHLVLLLATSRGAPPAAAPR